jgi:hypothetical protein
MFVRITKAQARKLFAQGDEIIFLCPCRMRPGTPFNMAAAVSGREYLEKAVAYKDHPDLWKGSVEATAWDLMFNNWAYYNASHECGYYPHYFIEK